MSTARLILYHKQSTSARTRFLLLGHGGVCAPGPLPSSATLAVGAGDDDKLAAHPASMLRDAESWLDLAAGSLEVEPGYRHRLTSDEGVIWVMLARFTSIDPPFEQAEAQGARFIDLTQARGLGPVELALLRKAYEKILG